MMKPNILLSSLQVSTSNCDLFLLYFYFIIFLSQRVSVQSASRQLKGGSINESSGLRERKQNQVHYST